MALCSKSWTDINIDLSTKTIRHCCKAQGEQYKTLSESFINSSPGVIQRREQSKQGIKHAQCNHCWKHEAKSSLSYRNIHNDPTLNYSKTDEELISFIEIKFDNVCNLGCVYCYEIESSTIAKEKNIESPFTKFDPNDVDIVVDYIKKILTKPRKQALDINILGGEPTLSKGYHQFIERLIKTHSESADIRMITTSNGNMSEQVMSRLFGYMEKTKWQWVWGFSGEATGKVFEQIRHGSSWQQWNNNLNQFAEHDRTAVISFNPTINLLSVKQFPNYIEHITKIKKPYSINPNFVLHPLELSIARVPKSFKKYIDQAKKIFKDNCEHCVSQKEVFKWFETLEKTIGNEDLSENELQSYLKDLNSRKQNFDAELLTAQTINNTL